MVALAPSVYPLSTLLSSAVLYVLALTFFSSCANGDDVNNVYFVSIPFFCIFFPVVITLTFSSMKYFVFKIGTNGRLCHWFVYSNR